MSKNQEDDKITTLFGKPESKKPFRFKLQPGIVIYQLYDMYFKLRFGLVNSIYAFRFKI